VIGITLTLFVATLDYFTRALQPLDDWFYDRRARLCQFFTPPPTDRLVHLDIDDASLEAVGKWPWPRAQLAEMMQEIDRAGATAVWTDIIFSEPSPPRYRKVGPDKFQEVDDDALFAAALRRSGNWVVPVAFDVFQAPPPIQRRLYEYLFADLELSEADAYKRLLEDPEHVLPVGSPFPADDFVIARRSAMKDRIARELERGPATRDELRQRLLPRTDPEVTGSPLLRLLDDEYRRALSIAELQRLFLPIPPGLPPLARFGREQVPIYPVARAAPLGGYVNYVQTGEGGTIRAIPLVAEYRGKLVPQTDLVLACTVLGVDVSAVRFYADRVIIPKPPGRDRDIVIPVRKLYAPQFGREIGMFMDVPDRGRRDWETLYDPQHREAKLHVPLGLVWEIQALRERIRRNNANLDKALSTILADDAPHKLALDPAKAREYAVKPPEPEDTATRRRLVEWTRGQLKESGLLELAKLTDADLKDKPEQRLQRDELIGATTALDALLTANTKFESQLADRRAQLYDKLHGRAAMIGYVASQGIDAYPTAIHPSCPGVVIHGMAFNAIMTGDFWRHAPKWVTALITLAFGLLVTAANGFLKPARSLLLAAVLTVAYLLINGLLLFDRGGLLVGVAGPVAALASVWSTGALAGFLIEAAERAHVTKRFSSYVDQKIVDYVIEHPDTALDGQVREMSVIFTDLAGFTTLSEQLRERSVGVLSDYLGLMVPVIRKHDGVLNKFLGDGIMCFFNAPYDDPDHAVHAVRTVLEMQRTMKAFAARMAEQGLHGLSMRCGVSTGNMVVGDSGPADYQDYTVLGDAVNFASRLESANKATGTNILISQRTTELLGDQFLLRPVGRLLVVGKSEGVMAYEPLAAVEEATPDERTLCSTSTAVMAA
jgi:class 3 adenylate cyclase/CHASE2 domain-containing sensor protein